MDGAADKTCKAEHGDYWEQADWDDFDEMTSQQAKNLIDFLHMDVCYTTPLSPCSHLVVPNPATYLKPHGRIPVASR